MENQITENMRYEGFLRKVFKCGRVEDPLLLAEAGINDSAAKGFKESMVSLRLGTAYAFGRLAARLEKELGDTGPNHRRTEEIIQEIMNTPAITYERIQALLEEGEKILEPLD